MDVDIGNMGMGIALRPLDGGHAVTVRDLRPEREALAAAQVTAVESSAAARFRVACEAGWADFEDAALYDLARMRPPPTATTG